MTDNTPTREELIGQVLSRLAQPDYCGRNPCTDPVHIVARLWVEEQTDAWKTDHRDTVSNYGGGVDE